MAAQRRGAAKVLVQPEKDSIKRQLYGRAGFELLRKMILLQ